MTRAERQAWNRLRAHVDKVEPNLAKLVNKALDTLRRSISVEQIEQILTSHDAFALHDLSSVLPTYLRPAVAAVESTFTQGVTSSGAVVPTSVRLGMRFNMVNSFVVRAAQVEAARLVVDVTNETRAAIRQVVARAHAEGLGVPQQARLIKPLIGLTRRQAAGVLARYRARIAQGMSRTSALALLQREVPALLRYRSKMIARTEGIRSSTKGQIAGWQAARAHGLLGQGAKKVWIVTPDDRLCPFCQDLEGVKVLLDLPFNTARHGRVDGPPLHPNCRCTLALDPGTVRVAA